EYTATACPGGRPPHCWLEDGQSLYDTFGFEWTLLCMSSEDAAAFKQAAQQRHIELTVVRRPEVRDLYEADFALIRPDQIVAWRGNSTDEAKSILAQLLDAPSTTH